MGIKIRDSNQTNGPPNKCTKIHVISTEDLVEQECSSPCDCDDDVKMTTISPVSDTVWKIGCYKINPSTPSGNIYVIIYLYLSIYIYI